jgi:hypothetical protein
MGSGRTRVRVQLTVQNFRDQVLGRIQNILVSGATRLGEGHLHQFSSQKAARATYLRDYQVFELALFAGKLL